MEPELKMEPSTAPVRLDLACGLTPRDGFTPVDLYAPGAERVDLCKFPWPWADSSVDELHCSHFIEHIPLRDVEHRDLVRSPEVMLVDPHANFEQTGPSAFIGQDMLFAFFDEAWRVLKPGGILTVLCPSATSTRAFQDPTHRRFIVAETFGYFSEDWRRAVNLTHYRVRANFGSNVVPIIPTELTLLHPEAQARRFREAWNCILDWQATMKAIK